VEFGASGLSLLLRRQKPEDFYAFPALFKDGAPVMRRDFRRFFDSAGLGPMESEHFANSEPGIAANEAGAAADR
jgi:hypothetical protein